MTSTSLVDAMRLVDDALAALNGGGEETPCQGYPVPFVDIQNVTQDDAAYMCRGCPLMAWKLPDGSTRNICLILGRAEGGSAVGYVYGGQVIRRTRSKRL